MNVIFTGSSLRMCIFYNLDVYTIFLMRYSADFGWTNIIDITNDFPSKTVSTIAGFSTAATDDVAYISGNSTYWCFSSNINIKSGSLNCTLPYGGNYYVRLQTYTPSSLSGIFPNATTAAIGSVIKTFIITTTNTGTGSTTPAWMALVKEDANDIRLIGELWRSSTSGQISRADSYFVALRSPGMMFSQA